MKLIYRPLLEIQLRHGFYSSGFADDTFNIVPSSSTLDMLRQYDLIMRENDTGFVIYAEVNPASAGESVEDVSPAPLAELKNEHRDETLRLCFYLQPNTNYLSNITRLKRYAPGQELFYFNNLRDDSESGLLLLGDSFSAPGVGDAITLITADTVTYQFATAVHSATLQIDDSFGNTLYSNSFTSGDSSFTTLQQRIDLSDIDSMPGGRYIVTHIGSGEAPQVFYYDPGLFSLKPFAVIEIFDTTVHLTHDGAERVNSDYQFLIDNEIQPIDPYALQLEARTTTWRYNVIKKYDSNPYSLANLDDISDFTKLVDGDRAVYLANSERALSEQPSTIALNHSGTKLRNLPSPQITTQLQPGAGEDSYISDMFVYV